MEHYPLRHTVHYAIGKSSRKCIGRFPCGQWSNVWRLGPDGEGRASFERGGGGGGGFEGGGRGGVGQRTPPLVFAHQNSSHVLQGGPAVPLFLDICGHPPSMAPHPVNIPECTVTFLPNQLCKCQLCQRVTQDVTPHNELKAGEMLQGCLRCRNIFQNIENGTKMASALLSWTPWCQGVLSAPHTRPKNPLAYLGTRPADSVV